MVRDVRQPVRRLARRLDEDDVRPALALGVGRRFAERGGLEPRRAVLLVGESLLRELLDDVPHGARLVEAALVELAVHADPEAAQGRVDLGEDGVAGGGREARLVGLAEERVAVRVREGLRDVGDVAAEVAAVGEALGDRLAAVEYARGRLRSDDGGVAGEHGLAEDAHLAAGIVEVVLACDGVAGPLQQRRDGVAEDGVAAVADRERAGRVGRDVLDDGRLAGVVGRPSVRVARREEVAEAGGEVARGEADVEKARPGDLDRGHARRVDVDAEREGRSDGARRAPERLGELERDVRREVAVVRVGGRLELDRDRGGVEAVGQVRQAREGGADGGGEGLFHGEIGQSCAAKLPAGHPASRPLRCPSVGLHPLPAPARRPPATRNAPATRGAAEL